MSFVDTVGPFVFFVMLGIAAVIAATALVFGFTAKHVATAHELTTFNRQARRFVDDLIAETRTGSAVIPPYLTDDLFALKDNDLNYHKEIHR